MYYSLVVFTLGSTVADRRKFSARKAFFNSRTNAVKPSLCSCARSSSGLPAAPTNFFVEYQKLPVGVQTKDTRISFILFPLLLQTKEKIELTNSRANAFWFVRLELPCQIQSIEIVRFEHGVHAVDECDATGGRF